MKERLRQVLFRRRKRRIVNPNLKLSAVLVPIYDKHGEFHLLFTKRTQTVKSHKGEISFPGGAYEEEDGTYGTLVNTALRECTEEIGVAARDVEVLGELDDFQTTVSGYIISPFVGLIPWPYQFTVNPLEIDELIEIPIASLLDMTLPHEETLVMEDSTITSFYYHHQGSIIWGATARILKQFLDVFIEATQADDWESEDYI